MADLAGVETALVGLATAALYPGGLAEPSSVGADCRIYRGWPAPAALDTDLRAGRVNVTVFPDSAPGQSLTRYPSEWHGTPTIPTLLGSVAGDTVSFTGTADAGQVSGIKIGNRTFVYRTVSGDTPYAVVANLAALIRQERIVHLAGSSVSIPGAASIVVRTVADSPAVREVRRQSHDIRISFWCPTPTLRDNATETVDIALAALTFVGLPDTSQGRIGYKNTAIFDQSQSAILYRRDLIYSVEYPTIVSASLPSMIFGDLLLNAIDVRA
jgi:hypothetical protein